MNEDTLDTQFITTTNIRPNGQRAKTAQLLIWIVMAFDIISMISSYMQYDLLIAFQNGETITNEAFESNDLREQMIGFIYLAIFIVSGITFIQWFRRAYYNLSQRTTCAHSEGWAAGAWFVPIISLFRPYQIMKEMWKKTTNLILSGSDNNTESINSTIIGWWWALWIFSSFIGNYVMRTAFKAETVDNFINMSLSDIVLSAVGIPLAIITVRMVKMYALKEEKLSSIEITQVEETI